MKTVYILQHVQVADDGEEENIKLIGAYSSEAIASAAIARLSSQPGFRDHPAGFHISEIEIDKDHWAEGFISWAEAAKSSD